MARNNKKKYERLIAEGSFDPTFDAAEGLEKVLGDMSKQGTVEGDAHEEIKKYVDVSDQYGRLVDDALEGKISATRKKDIQQLVDIERKGLRVLMITTDLSIFEDGSEVQSRFLTYSDSFNELHVIVLTQKEDGFENIIKFGDRVWAYPTNSTSWFRSMYDAYQLALSQISFASGFRADIIAATSPFEEGVVSYFLAKKFKRTFLVEILGDPLDHERTNGDGHDGVRAWFLRFTLKRADCVRTASQTVRNKLLHRYRDLEKKTIALPFFHNLSFWRDTTPAFDLKERYSQFSFIFLAVAALKRNQHISELIEACAPYLSRYPNVGLVIVGEGSLQKELEKQVIKLNIRGKVVLETRQEVTVSHMKSADVFINTGSKIENLQNLYKAAAAGTPVVTASGVEGGFVFIDNETGFVCPIEDSLCFQKALNALLNNASLRETFSREARKRAFDLYARDKERYYQSYKIMCEECVLNTARREKKEE